MSQVKNGVNAVCVVWQTSFAASYSVSGIMTGFQALAKPSPQLSADWLMSYAQ